MVATVLKNRQPYCNGVAERLVGDAEQALDRVDGSCQPRTTLGIDETDPAADECHGYVVRAPTYHPNPQQHNLRA